MKIQVPDKIMKQLKEFVADKIVVCYEKKYQVSHYNPIYAAYQQVQELHNSSLSVIKITRPMRVEDIFNNDNKEEQDQLEQLFNLEKEVEQLRQLKASIDNIKNVLK